MGAAINWGACRGSVGGQCGQRLRAARGAFTPPTPSSSTAAPVFYPPVPGTWEGHHRATMDCAAEVRGVAAGMGREDAGGVVGAQARGAASDPGAALDAAAQTHSCTWFGSLHRPAPRHPAHLPPRAAAADPLPLLFSQLLLAAVETERRVQADLTKRYGSLKPAQELLAKVRGGEREGVRRGHAARARGVHAASRPAPPSRQIARVAGTGRRGGSGLRGRPRARRAPRPRGVARGRVPTPLPPHTPSAQLPQVLRLGRLRHDAQRGRVGRAAGGRGGRRPAPAPAPGRPRGAADRADARVVHRVTIRSR